MENQQIEASTVPNPALNVFAILGFIALLIVGLWSVIQLVQQGSRLLSGMGSRTTSSLSTSLVGTGVALSLESTTLESEKPTMLSFKVGSTEGSTLSLSYACREDFYFEIKTSEETAFAIPCNAPFALESGKTSVEIIPVSNTAEKILVPITLTLTDANGKVMTDSDTVTVTASKGAPTTPVAVKKEVTETVVVPAPEKQVLTKMVPVKKSDPAGLPDLTVKILRVGVRNASGDVVEKSVFSVGDAPVVEFEVANIGTKIASGWKFSATLPTNPAYTYESPAQDTLYAGAVANLSMSFDKLTTGAGIIRISVDTQNGLVEAVETNNGASKQIVVQ
ncbi:MAG: CARDB domain-containing protein [Minisyncoccia bacterium]